MSLAVVLSKRSTSYLRRLDPATQRRFATRFRELAEHPLGPPLSKPLTGRPGIRSSRLGDWRILFSVDLTAETLTVHAIGPRGEVYR